MNSRILERNREASIPPGYEHLVEPAQYELVEKTWRNWNMPARDFLRSETGLKLSVNGKQQSVSIIAKNYVPREFDWIIKQIGLENWLLGRKRPMLESLRAGTVNLGSYFDQNPKAKNQLNLLDREIDSIGTFNGTLDKIIEQLPHWQIEVFAQFREINRDVLGAYFYEIPHIELYWIPIVLIAESIHASIEDLTILVLIHELAHAYTHVGMDIGGRSWPTSGFAGSDRAVLEGLAQYYTYIFLASIQSDRPNVMEVFERLLAMQPDDYHTHKIWMEGALEGQSEAIRLALLDARLQGMVNKQDFAADAAANKRRLGSPQQ
jgi:hypothetical protein